MPRHGAIWGLHHGLDGMKPAGCWMETDKEICLHIRISPKNWFEIVCLKYLFRKENVFGFQGEKNKTQRIEFSEARWQDSLWTQQENPLHSLRDRRW